MLNLKSISRCFHRLCLQTDFQTISQRSGNNRSREARFKSQTTQFVKQRSQRIWLYERVPPNQVLSTETNQIFTERRSKYREILIQRDKTQETNLHYCCFVINDLNKPSTEHVWKILESSPREHDICAKHRKIIGQMNQDDVSWESKFRTSIEQLQQHTIDVYIQRINKAQGWDNRSIRLMKCNYFGTATSSHGNSVEEVRRQANETNGTSGYSKKSR